jgi:hypothetical protein
VRWVPRESPVLRGSLGPKEMLVLRVTLVPKEMLALRESWAPEETPVFRETHTHPHLGGWQKPSGYGVRSRN